MNVICWFLCQDSSDHATTSSYAPSKTEQEASAAEEAGKERRRRQKLANKDNLFCQVVIRLYLMNCPPSHFPSEHLDLLTSIVVCALHLQYP